MRPNTLYRRPDRLVGMVDQLGRFSYAHDDQEIAETLFHIQRLNDALFEFELSPYAKRTAKYVNQLVLRWGISGVKLLKMLRTRRLV